MSSRIEDYALIGDCETAALVSKDDSIDWLCWPRFDSAACFAALLGDADNGRWQIAPSTVGQETKVEVKRRYRRNTLVLETGIKSTRIAALPSAAVNHAAAARPSNVTNSRRLIRITSSECEHRVQGRGRPSRPCLEGSHHTNR